MSHFFKKLVFKLGSHICPDLRNILIYCFWENIYFAICDFCTVFWENINTRSVTDPQIVSQGSFSRTGAEKPAHIYKCSGVGGRCFERKTAPWNSPGDLHRCKRTARQSRHRSWDLNSTMALSCPLAAPMLVKDPYSGRQDSSQAISRKSGRAEKSEGSRETRSSKFYTTIP